MWSINSNSAAAGKGRGRPEWSRGQGGHNIEPCKPWSVVGFISCATSGWVEPGLNADLSPAMCRGHCSEAFLMGFLQWISWDLSSLACPIMIASLAMNLGLLLFIQLACSYPGGGHIIAEEAHAKVTHCHSDASSISM